MSGRVQPQPLYIVAGVAALAVIGVAVTIFLNYRWWRSRRRRRLSGAEALAHGAEDGVSGGPGVIVVAADGSLKGKKDEGKRISFRRAASPLRSPSRLEDEDAWDGKTLKEEGVGRRSADSERREDPVVGTSVDSARKDEDQKGGVADHAVDIVTDVGLSPDDKDAIKPDAGVVASPTDTLSIPTLPIPEPNSTPVIETTALSSSASSRSLSPSASSPLARLPTPRPTHHLSSLSESLSEPTLPESLLPGPPQLPPTPTVNTFQAESASTDDFSSPYSSSSLSDPAQSSLRSKHLHNTSPSRLPYSSTPRHAYAPTRPSPLRRSRFAPNAAAEADAVVDESESGEESSVSSEDEEVGRIMDSDEITLVGSPAEEEDQRVVQDVVPLHETA